MQVSVSRSIRVGIVALFVSACAVSTSPTVQPTSQPLDTARSLAGYFPLAEGAYWVYEGTVKWERDGRIQEATMTWKMEVTEVVDRDQVVGYAMKGHPHDLAWYQEGRERTDYAIIRAGATRFYRTDIETLERLRDESDALIDLVQESQVFLDIPLVVGKRFCETYQMTRYDGGYCWVVGQEERVELEGIRGIPSPGAVSKYNVYFFTNPDHVIVEFVPGIGIVHYIYVHHGTVSEVDVTLVEYHPGSEPE